MQHEFSVGSFTRQVLYDFTKVLVSLQVSQGVLPGPPIFKQDTTGHRLFFSFNSLLMQGSPVPTNGLPDRYPLQ